MTNFSWIARKSLFSACAFLALSVSTAAYADSGIKMLPPHTLTSGGISANSCDKDGAGGLLFWDGINPIICVPGTSVQPGSVTSTNLTATTAVNGANIVATTNVTSPLVTATNGNILIGAVPSYKDPNTNVVTSYPNAGDIVLNQGNIIIDKPVVENDSFVADNPNEADGLMIKNGNAIIRNGLLRVVGQPGVFGEGVPGNIDATGNVAAGHEVIVGYGLWIENMSIDPTCTDPTVNPGGTDPCKGAGINFTHATALDNLTATTCPAGQALTKTDATTFACVVTGGTTITTGNVSLSFNCPSGQVLTGVSNNQPVCSYIANVSCPAGQLLTGITNGQAVCANAPIANAQTLFTENISYDQTVNPNQTPAYYNTDMVNAIANWSPLSGNAGGIAASQAQCEVDAYGNLPANTVSNPEVLAQCGQMLCTYKIGHLTQLDQLGGNCSTTSPNCGAEGRMGFGINWNCMFSN